MWATKRVVSYRGSLYSKPRQPIPQEVCAGEWKEMTPDSINIDATRIIRQRLGAGQSFRVILDGQSLWLPSTLFRMLAILALERSNSEGWVESDVLIVPSQNVYSYLGRLRATIWRQVPKLVDWPVFCNDYKRHYRLDAEPSSISFNRERLIEFGDAYITGKIYQRRD